MATAKNKAESKVVRPGKEVVASMADGFKEKLLEAVKDGTKELIIDFNSVEMIDSIGIGVIIAAHNSMSNAGGTISVRNLSPDIYGLFKMMRLDQRFEVTPVG